MLNKSYIFLLISFFLISCSGNEEINETASGFPVLSYSAEISETLNLDPRDIMINEPKEVNFWSQHFLNPSNDLDNIYTKILNNNTESEELKKILSLIDELQNEIDYFE